MSHEQYTVAQAIVEELLAAKVEVVFGIVSVHNMPIYNEILKDGTIRMVTARGESGAVNMADAYARVTGKLGVVLTSTGTGAGNGAGSLAETWNSGTPLLHITGEIDSNYIGTDQRYIHEAKDQLKMMDGASKVAYQLNRPKLITPFMRQAIKQAQTAPLGPVTIQIPTNFQAMIIPNHTLIETEMNSQTEGEVNLPEEIIQKIAAAKRPVIWAGNGVIHSGASEELLTLVETIQPAVITSESGKGSIPESHPLCIGNFSFFPQFEALLEKSDLLISIGVHFRAGETNSWTSPVPEDHINIDADLKAFNRNFETRYGIVGDAKAVLKAINQSLAKHDINPDAAYVEEVKDTRQAVRDDLLDSIGPYADIVKSMREQLPGDTVLVTDVTIPGYTWANKLIDTNAPRHYVHMAGEGIGQGLPMAIGAKVGAEDRPVVLVSGDRGFMVNSSEMISAIQEDAPVIVLLFDDGGYGILKYYQEAAYGKKTGVDLVNPNFVMLAESMGFEAEKVKSIEEFDKGLAKAISSGKASMIVIDVEAIGILEYEDSDEYIRSFRPHH